MRTAESRSLAYVTRNTRKIFVCTTICNIQEKKLIKMCVNLFLYRVFNLKRAAKYNGITRQFVFDGRSDQQASVRGVAEISTTLRRPRSACGLFNFTPVLESLLGTFH